MSPEEIEGFTNLMQTCKFRIKYDFTELKPLVVCQIM